MENRLAQHTNAIWRNENAHETITIPLYTNILFIYFLVN